MIYTQCNYPELRDLFVSNVEKIFGTDSSFLDYIENEDYNPDAYDCFFDGSDENYIINRWTGEYINWYKFSHIGRDIHINMNGNHQLLPNWLEKFLRDFKAGGGKNECSSKS